MKAEEEKEPLRIPMADARANLSEAVNQARYVKRPVILTSRGKEVAMIVGMEYLDDVMRKFLEK